MERARYQFAPMPQDFARRTDEVALAKSQLKGQLTLSLESVSSRMYRAAGVELYEEPYRTLDEILAEIDAITPSDVLSVCREFLAPDDQTVLSLGPAGIE